jgi:hypothetical protein
MSDYSSLISEKEFSNLKRSIEWSNQQLRFPRKERLEAIKQMVGTHYMERGSDKIMPLNMSKLAVDIYGRFLIPNAPRAMITTRRDDLKPTAANFELAINQIPDEIDLEMTLRKFVIEALFMMGTVKVGLSYETEIQGQPYGDKFVDLVTQDDYFFDMSAKSMDLRQYQGNDYWVDLDEVEGWGWSKKDLKADEFTTTGPEGESRAEGISVDSSASVFRERVWLRDVFIPSDRLVITYGVKSGNILHVVKWRGLTNGPYYDLGFSYVPGNLLPLPPVSVWRDLNELNNGLLRKLGSQADSQKSVLGFNSGDVEGVEAFKQARDGDGIRYNQSPPTELTTGGVDARTLAFFLQVKQLTSYIAGNLDSLGGLAPMSQTIGQDRLLGEAAGAQLRDMSTQVVKVVRDIYTALAWYEWNDPIKTRDLQKKIPDTDQTIPVKWNRESKVGDFDFYDLDIDVYSLQDNSPAVKLQKIGAIVGQYVLPLMPLIQQQNGVVNVQKILQDVAKYSDMHEVESYVEFADLPLQGTGGSPVQAASGGRIATQEQAPAAPQAPQSEFDMQQLLSMDNQ